MRKVLFGLVAVLFLSLTPVHAWDCPKGQIHQQVPIGTPGSVVVEGEAFICVPQNPPPDPGTGTNNNQNSNTNNSQSTATSSSSATGGSANQSQDQKQNQNQTSTSDSSASNGSQQNSQSANYSSTYNQVRQIATAIAPDAIPSAPCVKGFGAATQTGFFGGSFGGGKVDKGCDSRETARSFALIGNREAAAIILCSTPAAKRARLTAEQCQAYEALAPAPVVTPERVTASETIITPAPAVTVNITPATPTFTVIPPPVVPAPATLPRILHPHKPCACTITNDNINQPVKK